MSPTGDGDSDKLPGNPPWSCFKNQIGREAEVSCWHIVLKWHAIYKGPPSETEMQGSCHLGIVVSNSELTFGDFSPPSHYQTRCIRQAGHGDWGARQLTLVGGLEWTV